jgi:hypothetical protein
VVCDIDRQAYNLGNSRSLIGSYDSSLQFVCQKTHKTLEPYSQNIPHGKYKRRCKDNDEEDNYLFIKYLNTRYFVDSSLL